MKNQMIHIFKLDYQGNNTKHLIFV